VSVGDWIAVISIAITLLGAILGALIKCVSWVVGREMSGMSQGIAEASAQVKSVATDLGEIKAGVAYLKEEQRKTGEAFDRVWTKFDEHDKRLWELARRRKKPAKSGGEQ